MDKRKNIIKVPKALFEDEEVATNRGEYISNYTSNRGKIVPDELIHKHGYYIIPQSIMVAARMGMTPLADFTFLFACYYVASIRKSRNIRMDDVFDCITKYWNEFRTCNAARYHIFDLNNMGKYNRWIKKYEHNNKYYVKF